MLMKWLLPCFVSSYHLLGPVQILPLRAEVVHIINNGTIACAILFGVRLEAVYSSPLHTAGLPTSWPWSQLLLISLENRRYVMAER